MNDELDKKIVLGLALTLALLLATGVYWFAEPSRQQRVVQSYKLATAEIFAQNCFQCHGEQGRGHWVGPSLRDTKLDEEGLKRTISRGVIIMPAWAREEGGTLNSFEIQGLAAFILSWDEKLMEEALARHPIPGVELGKRIVTLTSEGGEEPPGMPPFYAGMKPPFPWGDKTAVEKGKLLYEKTCKRCHYPWKEPPPPYFNRMSLLDPPTMEEHADYYFWTVSEGRLHFGGTMPAFKTILPEKQRWQLLNYLWSLGKEYP